MVSANLPENLSTTYPAGAYTEAQREAARVAHLQDTETVHRVVNHAAIELHWNDATLQWDARPAGVRRVDANSEGYPGAVPPHTQAQTGFVVGDAWVWDPAGGPA